MKHILPLAAFVGLISLAGCTTQIGVDNPDNNSASWSAGTLTTTYKSDVSTVFAATKRALDGMRDVGIVGRTGESPERNELGEMTGVIVYARGLGDVQVRVSINKAIDANTGTDCTQVDVRWGMGGNAQQSQQVIHRISQSLGR
jgi:hypothetical protein